MRVSVNWRFLLGFFLVLAVSFVGLHFFHRYQVRQQAGAFLIQADAARDATPTNSEREMAYLQRYLVSRPNANDERERFARLLGASAKSNKQLQNAFIVIEDVLRRDPSRDSLRKFAVEIALNPNLQLTAEAKGHLEILREKKPGDGELENLYAFCLGRDGQFQESAELYEIAYTHKPDQVTAYDSRAFLLREKLSKVDEADKVIRLMVEKNPDQYLAHFLQARYWRSCGKLEAAAAAIALAKRAGPNELAVILFSAELSLEMSRKLSQTRRPEDIKVAEGKLAEARLELERGIPLHAKSADLHLLYLLKARMEPTPRAAVDVLQAGLRAIPDNPDLLESLADYQIQANDSAGAVTALSKLEKMGVPPDRLAFNRSNLLILKEDWVLAAEAFEAVRRNSVGNPQRLRLASLRAAECYEEIGETDRRLESFTRAIPDDSKDPIWVAALLGQARAYTAMGRIEDALITYQKLVDHEELGKIATSALVQVARLRMILVLRTVDPAKQDWKLAEQAVKLAVQTFPDDIEVLLIQSDLHVLRKQPAEANKIVEALFAKWPKDPAVWVAKASQQYREVSHEAGVAFMERGRKELGDTVEMRLAQARFLDPKFPDAGRQMNSLGEATEKFTNSGRRRLYRGLAELAGLSGNTKLADQFWDLVVKVQPSDLAAHLIRFDRFLKADDDANLKLVLADISRVDGETGASTRAARAYYLIWDAQRKAKQNVSNTESLDEALVLLDSLERDRPNWSRVSLGKARVWDLRNNRDEALPQYRRAVDRGVSDSQILRRLIELLASKGQFTEANDVLSKLPDSASGSPDTQRLAAEISLETANPKRALELAAKAIPSDSKNPADWLWLGRVRDKAGDRGGAGQAYQQAVTLNPKAPDGWLLLIQHLATTSKTNPPDYAEAKAKIELASKEVPESVRTLLLAQCHELIGQYKQAQELYLKARLEKPNDPRVQYAEADFLMKTMQWASAREAWERLIPLTTASADDKAFAKKMVAICFAADPDYATSQRAVELLGMVPGGELRNPISNETPQQRLTRAQALAMQRDRASKLFAAALFEGERASLTPADRFMLAKLYNQLGERKKVRTTMLELLATSERSPLQLAYLSFFTTWLTDLQDYTEAAIWLTKLEQLQPDAPRTAELQIRILAGRKNMPAAKATLQKLADKQSAQLGAIAQLAERVGLLTEAEEYYKKFEVANLAKRPEVVLARAEFYGRNNRLKEAMEICDRAWENCSPLVVSQVCISILGSSEPGEIRELIVQVTKRIEDAVQTKGIPKAAVQTQMAFLRNLAGDYDGAITIFRSQASADQTGVAGKQARALALNNLAYLVAVHLRQHDDALAQIKVARGLIGDNSDLLDTQALVLMHRGTKADYEEARPLLEGIVAAAPSGVAYFHLALLEKKQNKKEEKLIAWQDANRLLLKASDLHPMERREYEAMKSELK